MTDRSGAYPSPPYWPDRLTGNDGNPYLPFVLILALVEVQVVQHTYIADGFPGPCVTVWHAGEFAGWWPCLTIERAERKAEAL